MAFGAIGTPNLASLLSSLTANQQLNNSQPLAQILQALQLGGLGGGATLGGGGGVSFIRSPQQQLGGFGIASGQPRTLAGFVPQAPQQLQPGLNPGAGLARTLVGAVPQRAGTQPRGVQPRTPALFAARQRAPAAQAVQQQPVDRAIRRGGRSNLALRAQQLAGRI